MRQTQTWPTPCGYIENEKENIFFPLLLGIAIYTLAFTVFFFAPIYYMTHY
jgi:hypothetical protein